MCSRGSETSLLGSAARLLGPGSHLATWRLSQTRWRRFCRERGRSWLVRTERDARTPANRWVSFIVIALLSIIRSVCFLHQSTTLSNHKITFPLVLENDTGRCRKKVGDRIGNNNSEPVGNTRRVWITMGMFFYRDWVTSWFFKSLSKMERSGPKERPGRFLIFSEATPFYIKI
jgi:hypothetical protein